MQLASLPDVVRGCEDVKMRNVEASHQAMAELRAQLDASAASSSRPAGGGRGAPM